MYHCLMIINSFANLYAPKLDKTELHGKGLLREAQLDYGTSPVIIKYADC